MYLGSPNITNIPTFQAAQAIRNVYFPVIASTGIVTNILSIVIFSSASLRKVHLFAYLGGLAVCDSVTLTIGLLFFTQRMKFTPVTTVTCKIFYFFFYSAIHTASSIHVFTTFERFLAVWKPFTLKEWHRKTPPVYGLLVIYSFWSLLNSQNLFTRKATLKFNSVKCDASRPEYLHFLRVIHPWLDATIYCFLPLLLLITFNILIIVKLKKSRIIKRGQKSMKLVNLNLNKVHTGDATPSVDINSTEHQASKVDSQEEQSHQTEGKSNENHLKYQKNGQAQNLITRTLLSVSFAYVFFTTPIGIVLIYEPFWNFRESGTSLASWNLARSIGGNLMFTNHAINFWIYCLTCRAFREQLLKAFKALRNKCIKCCERNKV